MQRRGELLAKIAMQREQIAATAKRWGTPLEVIDKGIAVTRFLRSNPALVAAAVAVFAFRRRRTTSMLASAWKLWRLYKRAQAFSAKMAAHLRPQ
jgi:hypothetical protein